MIWCDNNFIDAIVNDNLFLPICNIVICIKKGTDVSEKTIILFIDHDLLTASVWR
jgi:hypothetical protein